ncbi:hypothetical protein [Pseudomonas sp. ATCC PTA-122608]|uniref:hypothetical protein n=1 Tax=Pseudomonas sp. ATCC PTA-122608 TaxID=1771311 RepID=UPI001179C5D4|nr:hypothetical protein [Pseudomonas sp. ATCC PTA-122608]
MKITKLASCLIFSMFSISSIQAYATENNAQSSDSNAPVDQSVLVEEKGVYDGLRHAISGKIASHVVSENAETGVTVYAVPDTAPIQINL